MMRRPDASSQPLVPKSETPGFVRIGAGGSTRMTSARGARIPSSAKLEFAFKSEYVHDYGTAATGARTGHASLGPAPGALVPGQAQVPALSSLAARFPVLVRGADATRSAHAFETPHGTKKLFRALYADAVGAPELYDRHSQAADARAAGPPLLRSETTPGCDCRLRLEE